MASHAAALLAISLLVLWISPGKAEGRLAGWGGERGCLALRLLGAGHAGHWELGLPGSVNLGCPVCMPVSVGISGPLNSNMCLSLHVSEGLWPPLSQQALFPPASVSQGRKREMYLLKVGRMRDTEAELIVKMFNNS